MKSIQWSPIDYRRTHSTKTTVFSQENPSFIQKFLVLANGRLFATSSHRCAVLC